MPPDLQRASKHVLSVAKVRAKLQESAEPYALIRIRRDPAMLIKPRTLEPQRQDDAHSHVDDLVSKRTTFFQGWGPKI